MGVGTIGHFDPRLDTPTCGPVGQLTQLIISDDHRNAAIGPGHDSVTIAGMMPHPLQAVLSGVVHLH